MPAQNDPQGRLLMPLDDGPGPARPIPSAQTERMVSAAVRRVYGPWWARPGWARRGGLLLGVAGLTALSYVALRGAEDNRRLDTTAVAPSHADLGLAPPGQLPGADRRASPESSLDAGQLKSIVDAGSVRSAASQPTASHTTRHLKRASSSAPAQDLLRLANALRAERRWQASDRVYRRVVREYPRSDAAYAAATAAAALRLEKLGDPRLALALFQQVLAARPAGYLSEEAAFGLAECYRALGRIAAERDAWRSFLARFPRSVLRGQAEARLRALTGAKP